MNMREWFLAGTAVIGLTAASASFATTVEKEEFKHLVQQAHACVVAQTVGIEHVMENGAPVTKTTFNVTETAFGSTPETITVTTPGGRIQGAKVPMGEVNAGIPQFLNGTSAVLLLEQQANGDYVVSGVTQGVFDLSQTALGYVVRLPDSQGGLVSLSEALDVINDARDAEVNETAE